TQSHDQPKVRQQEPPQVVRLDIHLSLRLHPSPHRLIPGTGPDRVVHLGLSGNHGLLPAPLSDHASDPGRNGRWNCNLVLGEFSDVNRIHDLCDISGVPGIRNRCRNRRHNDGSGEKQNELLYHVNWRTVGHYLHVHSMADGQACRRL
ncbi:hypothetical protein BGZ89_005941, partial [Linnemannia elongata]